MPSRSPWRLSLQAWISLWALGTVLWLTVSQIGLILEMVRLLFGAFLLSLAIRPLANALAHWRIPRGITVLVVYVALIGVLVLMGALLIPVISMEVDSLRTKGPSLIQAALTRIDQNKVLSKWLPSVDTVSRDLSQRLDTLVQTFVTTMTQVGGFALELFIVLILSYFFVTDVGVAERLLQTWVPVRYQPHVRAVATNMHYRLARWVWAQVGIAVYFAVAFSTGLAILGVPFALTIGVVGGVLEIVPYLGGIIAWLLAMFTAITVHPIIALWVTLFYLVVVEIETHVIAPAFYGRVTGIHPAVVLIALVVGAKTKGIIGVLFAVPGAVVLITLLQELRVVLISENVVPPAEDTTPEHRTQPGDRAP
jgi:predicted PurR-regulated permease PerM